jgi:hypothetical protein
VTLQSSLFAFEPGRSPPRGGVDAEDLEPVASSSSIAYRGRKCAKCGRPLNGGGLELLGFGLVCWSCFHQGGRRDGRGDLSSDASGSRNSGYNLRR